MIFTKRIFLIICLLGLTSLAFAHGWMAPKKDAKIQNPVINNIENRLTGKTVYTDFCIHCHGNDAKGMDPEAIGLKKRPTNLKKTFKSHSDGDLFWKINTGRNEMPGFKDELEKKEIWSIIHYIRSL